MSARDDILRRVRTALDGVSPAVDVPPAPRTPDRGDLVALFAERVADYRAVVTRTTRADLGAAVDRALEGASAVVPAGLHLEVTGAVGDEVEVAVADGCGGIEEGTIERVFDVAFRGAEARTPDDPAEPAEPHPTARAGLGLAIVKGIVEAHRGRVEVTNVGTAPDEVTGCRFVVRLPLGDPA